MQTVRTKNNGNRFIAQYEWTIDVCITVQIGERGTCTDVQIGERGKQRVKCRSEEVMFLLMLGVQYRTRLLYTVPWKRNMQRIVPVHRTRTIANVPLYSYCDVTICLCCAFCGFVWAQCELNVFCKWEVFCVDQGKIYTVATSDFAP